MNAILNAQRSVRGLTIYTSLSPCVECAKTIAASGISRVVTQSSDYANPLRESIDKAKDVFRLNGILYEELPLNV